MKVAILGAQGFIGSNIFSSLKIAGHAVTAFTKVSVDNTKDREVVGEFDWILNFAGKTSIPESFSDSVGVYKQNIEIALSAMQMASSAGAVLLNVSSYVYGVVPHPPASEADPVKSSNPYMGSKIAIERILTDLAEVLNVGLVTLRPSNIYGYGQQRGMLVSSLIQSAHEHNEVVVNDPEPIRDYLYIADFSDLILSLVETGCRFAGETFNVGSGVPYSNFEVAELVREQFCIEAQVRSLNKRRTADILDGSLNITKVQTALDWEPQYSLAQGIKELVTGGFVR
jgi:nucleoside-diphosphate-sugar epimerase